MRAELPNGVSHSDASVTRTLIGFSTIDTLSGYTASSKILNPACTQNSDSTGNWSVRAYALTQGWTEGTGKGGQTKNNG
jgi:hypothetical protein